jgi:hypothetical protein
MSQSLPEIIIKFIDRLQIGINQVIMLKIDNPYPIWRKAVSFPCIL